MNCWLYLLAGEDKRKFAIERNASGERTQVHYLLSSLGYSWDTLNHLGSSQPPDYPDLYQKLLPGWSSDKYKGRLFNVMVKE